MLCRITPIMIESVGGRNSAGRQTRKEVFRTW